MHKKIQSVDTNSKKKNIESAYAILELEFNDTTSEYKSSINDNYFYSKEHKRLIVAGVYNMM